MSGKAPPTGPRALIGKQQGSGSPPQPGAGSTAANVNVNGMLFLIQLLSFYEIY